MTRLEGRPYIHGTYNSIFLRCFQRGTLKTSYGFHNVHKYSRYNMRGYKKSCESVFGFWRSEGRQLVSRQGWPHGMLHFRTSKGKFVRIILLYLRFEHVNEPHSGSHDRRCSWQDIEKQEGVSVWHVAKIDADIGATKWYIKFQTASRYRFYAAPGMTSYLMQSRVSHVLALIFEPYSGSYAGECF